MRREQIAVFRQTCIQNYQPPVLNADLGCRAGEGVAHAKRVRVRQRRVGERIGKPALVDAACNRAKGEHRDDAR